MSFVVITPVNVRGYAPKEWILPGRFSFSNAAWCSTIFTWRGGRQHVRSCTVRDRANSFQTSPRLRNGLCKLVRNKRRAAHVSGGSIRARNGEPQCVAEFECLLSAEFKLYARAGQSRIFDSSLSVQMADNCFYCI